MARTLARHPGSGFNPTQAGESTLVKQAREKGPFRLQGGSGPDSPDLVIQVSRGDTGWAGDSMCTGQAQLPRQH